MIHVLGRPVRKRTNRDSSWKTIRSALRAFATFGVAAAILAPVGTDPAVADIVCPAGAVTWTAPGDGNWSNPANWSTAAVPLPGQNVCIEDQAVTVTVDNNFTANQLVSTGTVHIAQFWILTLNGPSDIERLTAAGSLAGPGPVTLTGPGSSWTSGTFSTTLEIASTAEIDIGGSTTKNLTGTLINRGTVDQTGTNLRIGTVTNRGNWNLTNPGNTTVINNSTGNPTFTNYGLVERSGTIPGRLADVVRNVEFRNHGTIAARTGVLQISGFQEIGDGSLMHADATAHLIASAVSGTPGTNVTGASTITSTGDGVVEWRSNRFTLAAGAVVDARSGFLFNGIDLAGPGKVSVSGPAGWERGVISGNLEITPTGSLNIDSFNNAQLRVTGNLTNNGTVTQPEEFLYTSEGALVGSVTNNSLWQFTNTASKSFMIRGDGPFVNRGTLEGSATAGITGIHIDVDVQNTGTVASRAGQFWIRSASTHYASPTLTGGTWEARNGSGLFFPTTFSENNANLILAGPGSYFGYLAGLDVFTTNTGTFELTGGADYATAGSFSSSGSLIAGSATTTDVSTLTVNGDLILGPTSTVEVGVGGSPTDMRYGMINVTGPASVATLGGRFQAQELNGYVPVPGHSYQVMAYPSMTGSFVTTDVDPFYSVDVQPDAVYLNGIDPIPIADAGPATYTVNEGSTIVLDGSNSIDPGGAIVSYEWQTAGWFTDNAVEQPTFTNTADDGNHAVTLQVCDFNPQCDTDTTTVDVLNVKPDVVGSITTLTIDEGTATGTIELATFDDPGADTHTSTIDWGDSTIEAGGAGPAISGDHTYAQSGGYTITVTVTDDDGGVGSTTIAVTVANVTPIVTPGTPTLVEGDGTTNVVLADVTDPGAETFSANMDWGDTSGVDMTVSIAGSPLQVTGSHAYADDGSYAGTVCVADDEPQVCSAVTVDVTNARPTMDVTEATVSAMVGNLITINGTYGDAGVNDTHTADIDWKDGSSDLDVPVSGNTFTFDHTYTTDGTFSVDVCITDDDGGRRCDSVQADIKPIPNVAPEVVAGGPYSTTEGAAADLLGTASDPNGDPFTTEWTSPGGGSFGDATNPVTTFTAADQGTFIITLTGTDSPFGAQASDDTTVTVTNVAPSIDSLTVDDGLPEGSIVDLSATFSDPGVDDTHNATVDWGDDPAGTPEAATVSGRSVSASHPYTQDGTFTVQLCVSDTDGGANCSSTDITVNNVLPAVTAIADQEIDEGDTVGPMVIASFTEPGADSWTATVDWGDGGGAEPASVDATAKTVTGEHTYNTAGNYTATVCVIDDHGQHCDGFAADVAAIATEQPEEIDPVADAGGPYEGREGRWIRVDGRDSSDEDGELVSYKWSSSEGGRFNNTTVARPKFKAKDDGTYILTLVVTDNDGNTDSTTTTVYVSNVAPNVNSGRNATIKKGQTHRLSATFVDPGNDTHRTIIDWGDGDTTTIDPSRSPVKSDHRYSKPGKYKVKVTVIDDDGGRDSDSHTVTVKNVKTDRHHKRIKDFVKKLLDKWRKYLGHRGWRAR